MTTTDAASEFELELLRRTHEVAPHPLGAVVRRPDLPLVHGSNLLWVTATAGVDAAALEAAVRALRLPRVRVLHDALGTAVAPDLKAAGFAVERLVWLALGSFVPAPDVDGFPVHEASLDEAVAAWTADWSAAEVSPAAVEQLVEVRRRNAIAGGRQFGVAGTAAHCSLFLGDGIAQVEDVYTPPELRRRGIAGALISRAVEAVPDGRPVVMLAEPHAVSVYERLGFAVIGHVWEATRA